MSTRRTSTSSDVDARSASQCQNVEELEDELQATKSMLDQLRVVMKKREEDTSKSKHEAEEIIKKLSTVKARQKTRVQNLKSRLDELDPGSDVDGTAMQQKPGDPKPAEAEDLMAADIGDDDSVVSDLSVSDSHETGPQRLSTSSGLSRQLSETREKCSEKLREEKRKLEELSRRMEETIRQKNQEFEELQKQSFSDPLPDSDKLAGSVRQIIMQEKEINSLKGKIAELENTIYNLEESVREKDKIIEARTQAVALMSESLTKKNKEVITKLEDTRNEMVAMQENFLAKQDSWNVEREQLLQDLDQQTERGAQLTYQVQSLEAIRFDLSVRNAELQEKVVRFQDDTEDRIRRVEKDYQEDLEEMEDALNKTRNQMKIQAKAKDKEISSLKALVDSLEEQLRDAGMNVDVNVVQALEEENRILKSKVESQKEILAAVEAADDAGEWKRRLLMANEDLDRHVRSLASLEKDKLKLMQDLSERDRTITKLKRKLGKAASKGKKVRTAQAHAGAGKEVAEDGAQMTASEVEDGNAGELYPGFEEPVDREKIIASLMEEVEELRTRASDMEVINFGGMTDLVQELSTKDSRIHELESQVETDRGKIAELELEVAEKSAFIDDLTEQLGSKSSTLDRSEARVMKLTKDLENLQIQHKDHEAELTAMSEKLEAREAELSEAKEELERLKAALEEESGAGSKLRELEAAVEALEVEKTAAEDALVRTRTELASRNAAYEQLTADTERRLEELASQVDADEDDERSRRARKGQELEREMERLRAELECARAEIEAKSTELEELTEFATEKEQITAAHVTELKGEVEKLEKALAESTEELHRKEDSVAELAALLEETRAAVVERERQIRELETRVAALEAARVSASAAAPAPILAEPSSTTEAGTGTSDEAGETERRAEAEEVFYEKFVSSTVEESGAALLRQEERENTRRISFLVSERDQLQEDVMTMANDASALLVDGAKLFEENESLRDEVEETKKALESVEKELLSLRQENEELKETKIGTEQQREALNCEIIELSSRLDVALENLDAARKDLDEARAEKSRVQKEREEEAERAEKRISELLADFESLSAGAGGDRQPTSTPQHAPDALQSRLESIFRKLCIFVRSVAGACENVCQEKPGRGGSASENEDNWGDWDSNTTESETDELPWWKQYLDDPDRFLGLPGFWEKLRVFEDFVESVLYEELETLQMSRDELKRDLEAFAAEARPPSRDRGDPELAALRAERDAVAARLDAVADELLDFRVKCDEKEATIQSLMEDKGELEQRLDRLMVKTQNREARIAADQQAVMRGALQSVTVEDVRRALHRLSCELFPRFVAGDEPESESVLGGATSCPEFGSESAESAPGVTVEDAVKQALLELRARCFRSRSDDGEDGHVDVLDELRDRCVALREALDAARSDLEAKTRRGDELRAENGRLAQRNRELLAAAQQLSIQIGAVQDEAASLARFVGQEAGHYRRDFADVCAAVGERLAFAVEWANARLEIEAEYKNEVGLVKEQLMEEKEENEHLNEKIASLEKCVFSEHIENQVSEQDSEIERLRAQVDAVQKELDTTRDQLESLDREKMALQEERNRLQAEIRSRPPTLVTETSLQSVEDKDRELDSLKNEYGALKTKYTKALQRLKQLKTSGASPASSSTPESKGGDAASVQRESLLSENADLKERLRKAMEGNEKPSGDLEAEIESLRTQLKRSREELELTSARLADELARVEALSEQKLAVENDLKLARDENAEAAEKLVGLEEELRSRVGSADEALAELERQVAWLGEENARLRDDGGRASEELGARERRLSELEAELAARESEDGRIRADVERMCAELASLKEEVETVEAERDDLVVRLSSQATELERLGSQLRAEAESRESEIGRLEEAKNARVGELEEEKAQLQRECDDSRAKLNDLRQMLTSREEEFDSLGSENEAIRQILEEHRTELVQTREVCENQRNELQSLKTELEAANAKVEETSQSVEEYATQLRETEERVNRAEALRKSHVEELEAEIDEFRSQLEAKTRELNDLAAKLRDAGDFGREVEDLRKKIKEMETLLAMNEEERNDADVMFAKVSEELNSTKTANDELRRKIKDLEEELGVAKLSAETAENVRCALDKQVVEIIERCQEEEGKRRALEAEKAEMESEVEALKRIQSEVEAEHSRDREESQQRFAELGEKLSDLEAELAKERDEFERRLSELEQEKEVLLGSERERFLAEVDGLRSTISVLTDEKGSLAEQLRDAEEKILALEDAREEVLVTDEKLTLEATIREVQGCLAAAMEERNAILAAKTNAEATIVSLTSEIDSLQTFAADRQKEWESLTADLDERIAENLSYSQEVQQLREELRKVVEKKQELERVSEQLQKRQNEGSMESQDRAVEIGKETARLRAENEELKRTNAELTEQCAGLGSEVETLQSWLSRFKDSNVDHQSKEKDLAAENQDLQRRLAELEKRQYDVSDVEAERERQEAAYEELKTVHDSLYSEFSDLQNRYDSLKFEYDLARSERERMKADRVSVDEMQELKLALIDKDVLISDLESRLETESQAQLEEIEGLKSELDRLRQMLSDHEKKWSHRDEHSEELVKAMDEIQVQLEAQISEAASKDLVISSLQARIGELESSAQEKVESLTREKLVLEQELVAAKQQPRLEAELPRGCPPSDPAPHPGALRRLEEELEEQLRQGFSSKEAEYRYHKVCLELDEARAESASLRKRAADAEAALEVAVGGGDGEGGGDDVRNALYRAVEAEARLAAAVSERDQLLAERGELQERLGLLRRRNELLLNEMSDQWEQSTEDERRKEAGITPDEAVKMELDNTISALHARDVRCEELAFEVTSLTEERDSLQIQLSSALKRELELRKELRKEMQNLTSTLASAAESPGSAGDSDVGLEINDNEVARRIEELQKLNYNLDVQLATEREARKKLAEKLERRRRRLGKTAIPPRTPVGTPEPSSMVEEKDVTINSVVP